MGKIKIDLDKEFYTVKDISLIIGHTTCWTSRLLFNKGFKPAYSDHIKGRHRVFYYSKLDVFKFINLDVFISVPKKEKKSYFEFGNIFVESKINALWT